MVIDIMPQILLIQFDLQEHSFKWERAFSDVSFYPIILHYFLKSHFMHYSLSISLFHRLFDPHPSSTLGDRL